MHTFDHQNPKPVEWLDRPRDKRVISFHVDPDFYDEVEVYCKRNEIRISQLGRFLFAREVRKEEK